MSETRETSSPEPKRGTESAAMTASGPLRILGRANSFNVRKVLWVCDEIGIPFVREDFGRGFKRTDTPEFLKLNLTGQVPVVIDGTNVMRESNSIVRYLAAKHRAIDRKLDFGAPRCSSFPAVISCKCNKRSKRV